MSKAVSRTATARLKTDFIRLNKDPVPYVRAAPLPSNILIWYYVVTGPKDSPFHGGYYLGKLEFPNEYPFRPPAIYMITPNGRFKTNQKLCLSISDFHPDTWNPAWGVSSILTGLLSFMLENTPTSGSMESSDSTKKRFAFESLDYNLKDKIFCELFPELVEEIKAIKKEYEEKEKANRLENNLSGQNPTTEMSNNSMTSENWFFSLISNVCVILAVAAFALIVKYVFMSSLS